ncbi:Kdo2-lipid IVA lauroyltransferase/acyltransferase [Desulfosarcina sp. BuS5]|uniref:lysophospholipid acyltransferase family protein n=1 Tax=Desulfosarcina sp. BuS5 TaxID=933262 RepID=UPI000A03B6C8|nr:hypothetical protein [Desulfosarcina sp. BuS5]WDN88184.1 Kdo2-lipid IVA lauroyltransferase/acyltransferase [Desulfosarcina sp. BuS5]
MKQISKNCIISLLSLFIRNISRNSIINTGRLLGLAGYVLDLRHRRIVLSNLRFAYPQWSGSKVRTMTKRIFQNMGITILEICQLSFLHQKNILGKACIKGEDNLLNAINSGKGVIFISAHIGNWELSLLHCSYYIQSGIVLVASRIRLKMLDRWIHRLRSSSGNILIDKKGALPSMVKALRKGGALGLLVDQSTKRSEGVNVDFFGHKVTATPVVAMLAIRYNCIVLPAFCVREKDGNYTLIYKKPLRVKKTDDLKTDITSYTQVMTDMIENMVREYPDQWFWFHKRWKRYYPGLYPEAIKRRDRRRKKKFARQNKF